MSISVVVPCYTINGQLEAMALNCAKGYRSLADELIVVEDGGWKSQSLLNIADTYLYHNENVGFTKNLNMGWRLAKGDFVFLVNSDTYIKSGNLKNLCIPGKVTSPFMAGHTRDGAEVTMLNGSFFVVPREVQEERGMLDENMRMYCSDDDYYGRVKDIFKQVNSVIIGPGISATTSCLPREWKIEQTIQDRAAYSKKHDKRE